jgi:hypothetical protein
MSRKIRENVWDPLSKRFVHEISPIKTGGVREKITRFLDEIPCDSTGEEDCKTVIAQVKAAVPQKKPEFNPTQVVKIGSGGSIRREHNGFMGFLGARDREMFDMISEGK